MNIEELLHYVEVTYPECYDYQAIQNNIEVVVEASCDANKVNREDYELVGKYWEWSSVRYLKSLIRNLEGMRADGMEITTLPEVRYDDQVRRITLK